MAYVTGTSHPDTGVKKTQLINEVKCTSLLQEKIKKERTRAKKNINVDWEC